MHLDDETLALIALGDIGPDAAQDAHLAGCEQCSRELSELIRTVDYGKSSRSVELLNPPEHVWANVHSALGLTSSALPTTGFDDSSSSEAPVRRSRTPRLWWVVTAAALAIGIVAGIAVVVWWPHPSTRVVAEATLIPFPDWNASGTARLEQLGSAESRDLVVTLDVATATDLREVWLMDPQTKGLISLGQLAGNDGRFAVPPAVDLRQFSVVDISDEPADGNPAHSGNSIVRGQLRSP